MNWTVIKKRARSRSRLVTLPHVSKNSALHWHSQAVPSIGRSKVSDDAQSIITTKGNNTLSIIHSTGNIPSLLCLKKTYVVKDSQVI